MPPKKSSLASLFAQPEEQPVILAGAPDDLEGQLFLQNAGQERLTLRDLRVRQVAVGRKVPRIIPDAASFQSASIVLEPGQQQRVPVNLSLDKHTPPGDYTAELDAAGETRSVIIHVVESVDLDLEPRELVIDNQPGETVRKRVVISNQGNVPLMIGDLGEILLDDDRHNQRVLHVFLDSIGAEPHTLAEYAALLLQESRQVIEEAGVLQVTCIGSPYVLNPGDTQLIELEIILPPGLVANRRYKGRAAIYTDSLDFVVVPTKAPTKKS